jgi:hypothetical protein
MGGGTHYDLCRCTRASGTPGMDYWTALEVRETLNAPEGSMGGSVQLRGYAGRADMEKGLPEHPSTLQMQITPTI